MAIIKNGIFDAPSGKVGNLVFCQWKSISYIRAKPKRKKVKPRTPAQERQRARFRFMQKYLTPIIPYIRLGFQHDGSSRSAHNAAMSYNLKNALQETDGGLSIIPEKFMFSRGTLAPALRGSAVFEGTELVVRWDPQVPDSTRAPVALVMAYALEGDGGGWLSKAFGEGSEKGIQRIPVEEEDVFIQSPAYHVYLAFIATDGSNETSDSLYLGLVTYEGKP